MIYTVTANPAIDYTIATSSLMLGATNRAVDSVLSFGGKGVNVSRVLTALGVDNRALGFVAGDTGKLLERGLQRLGVDTDFIHLPAGQTRINVKLCGERETEINGVGPMADEASLKALTSRLLTIKSGDVLCLCGSLPQRCKTDFYADLLAAVAARDALTVVDAAGESLLAALPYHPTLIKPNYTELCELVGRELPDEDDIADAAKELQTQGAQNVLVSLGGDGALLLTADGAVLRRRAYRGTVRGTVGAGDSMVAGFVAATVRGDTPADCLTYAVAAGCATAFADGLADRAGIENLLAKGERL